MFDKTGTITLGKPELSRIHLLIPSSVCPLARILAIIGTAEANSQHPLAIAVVKFVKKFLSTTSIGQCKDFELESGYGIRCKVSNINHMFAKNGGELHENSLDRLNASINVNEIEIIQSGIAENGKF